MPKLIPHIPDGDWVALRRALNKLASVKLGPDASPSHAGLTLTDLTASRLVATDANKELESSDLVSWIDGTTSQITITDDADGTVTVSTPQDIHVDAHMELAGLTIKDSGGYIIFYVDDDEMYFTAVPANPVTGNPIGLLLALTYTV